MKIDIEKINVGKSNYSIPPRYKVILELTSSPMSKNFTVIAKEIGNNGYYAVFHFDGIEKFPVLIETLIEKTWQ